MRHKVIIACAIAGVAAGLWIAYGYSQPTKALPPAFNPASNPYAKGIFANGIVEAYQTHGQNINIYPEVAGRLRRSWSPKARGWRGARR